MFRGKFNALSGALAISAAMLLAAPSFADQAPAADIKALVAVGTPKALQGDSSDLWKVMNAVKENPSLASSAVTEMQPLLGNANPGVRKTASYVIGEIGINNEQVAGTVFNLLLPLLQDSDEGVRQDAAYRTGIIANIRDEYAKTYLNAVLPLLRKGAQSRYAALGSMTNLAEKLPVADLGTIQSAVLPALTDREATNRENALKAVLMLGMRCENYTDAALKAVKPLARDPSKQVREGLIEMLGMVSMLGPQTRTGVDAILRDMVNDPNPQIRAAIREIREILRTTQQTPSPSDFQRQSCPTLVIPAP